MPKPFDCRALGILAGLALGLALPAFPPARATTGTNGAPSTIALAPATADSTMADLAARLRAHPEDQAAAKAFRQRARRAGALDSAITILKGISNTHPKAQALRMQLALAHVDRLPAEPTLDLKAKAVVASQATRLLSEVIASEPEQWGPRYARGMTHMLFPLATRHYEPAAEDFLKLIELQRTLPPAPEFVRAYVVLGDAYVMDQQWEVARSWWQAGKKQFPEDPALVERLGLPNGELLSTIPKRYSFDLPFDTDADFFDLAPR